MKILIILLTTFLFFGFTPFAPIPPAPDTIATKGGLLTNNGTADVVAPACADDQILVWDSTATGDPYGFKCEAKPVAAAGTQIYFGANCCSPNYSGPVGGTFPVSSTEVANVGGVVVAAGQTVKLSIAPSAAGNLHGLNGDCRMAITRNGTYIRGGGSGDYIFVDVNPARSAANYINEYDQPSAGTYTYALRAWTPLGQEQCFIFNSRLVAEVF